MRHNTFYLQYDTRMLNILMIYFFCLLDVRGSVHHSIIHIENPTRCNSVSKFFSYKYEIRLRYTVASCWIFYVNYFFRISRSCHKESN
jgi:hypothetical protein